MDTTFLKHTNACIDFEVKGGKATQKVKIGKKRRNISTVVGGKAVTENKTLNKMKTFLI